MKEEIKSYVEKVKKEGDNKTIQLVPKYIHEFLLDAKKKFETDRLWEVIAHYLKDNFYKDFEDYLTYRGIQLTQGGKSDEVQTTEQQETQKG